MEQPVSYRLSFDEIIYLSAGQKEPAKSLFGLKGALEGAQDAEKWDRIKRGLEEKQFIQDINGKLVLRADSLERIISVISKPQSLIAVRPYKGGQSQPMTRLYIQGGLAVSVGDDRVSGNHYQVKPLDSHKQVYAVLEEAVYLGEKEKEYAAAGASMTLSIDELKPLMDAAAGNNSGAFYGICGEKGLDSVRTMDLFGALAGEKYLTVYTAYAFGPVYDEGRRAAGETLLYEGGKHLWKFMVSPAQAEISAAGKDEILEDMRVISRLLDYS